MSAEDDEGVDAEDDESVVDVEDGVDDDVDVVVAAGGAGGIADRSKAPRSAVPFMARVPKPRWSAVRLSGLLPASIAGLVLTRSIVCVGPPLLPSGSNCGSTACTPLASMEPLPLMPD